MLNRKVALWICSHCPGSCRAGHTLGRGWRDAGMDGGTMTPLRHPRAGSTQGAGGCVALAAPSLASALPQVLLSQQEGAAVGRASPAAPAASLGCPRGRRRLPPPQDTLHQPGGTSKPTRTMFLMDHGSVPSQRYQEGPCHALLSPAPHWTPGWCLRQGRPCAEPAKTLSQGQGEHPASLLEPEPEPAHAVFPLQGPPRCARG